MSQLSDQDKRDIKAEAFAVQCHRCDEREEVLAISSVEAVKLLDEMGWEGDYCPKCKTHTTMKSPEEILAHHFSQLGEFSAAQYLEAIENGHWKEQIEVMNMYAKQQAVNFYCTMTMLEPTKSEVESIEEGYDNFIKQQG